MGEGEQYFTSYIYIGNNGAKEGAGICQADGGGARLAIRPPKVLFNTKVAFYLDQVQVMSLTVITRVCASKVCHNVC